VRNKKRVAVPGGPGEPTGQPASGREAAMTPATDAATTAPSRRGTTLRALTDEEKSARVRALKDANRADEEARRQAVIDEGRRREEESRRSAEENARIKVEEEQRRRAEEDAKRKTEEDAKHRVEEEVKRKAEEEKRREVAERAGKAAAAKVAALTAAGKVTGAEPEAEEESPVKRGPRPELRRPATPTRRDEPRRRTGKLTVNRALNADEERMRSLASVRRAREKLHRQHGVPSDQQKIVRDVVVRRASPSRSSPIAWPSARPRSSRR